MLRSRNSHGRFTQSKPLDVRTEPEAKEAEKLINIGPVTLVLVYADWCGHCTDYKPSWKTLEDAPNRSANIIKVHHDMMDKIPSIANANIQGYPSVIKVLPNGKLEEYTGETGQKTNAMPDMRNMEKMRKEIADAAMSIMLPNAVKKVALKPFTGGALASVSAAFLAALQKAGPAALLLVANDALPKSKSKSKTFKSPKKANRRASTRKHRRF